MPDSCDMSRWRRHFHVVADFDWPGDRAASEIVGSRGKGEFIRRALSAGARRANTRIPTCCFAGFRLACGVIWQRRDPASAKYRIRDSIPPPASLYSPRLAAPGESSRIVIANRHNPQAYRPPSDPSIPIMSTVSAAADLNTVTNRSTTTAVTEGHSGTPSPGRPSEIGQVLFHAFEARVNSNFVRLAIVALAPLNCRAAPQSIQWSQPESAPEIVGRHSSHQACAYASSLLISHWRPLARSCNSCPAMETAP